MVRHYKVALACIYAASGTQIFCQILFHFAGKCKSCGVFAAGAGFINRPRDVAIQVLLLPMVYGLLSAINVRYMLNNMSASLANESKPMGNIPGLLFCHSENESASVASLVTHDRLAFAQATERQAFESNFALADAYEAWALYQYVELIVTVLVEHLKLHDQVGKSFRFLLRINLKGFMIVCVVGAMYSVVITWLWWRLGYDPTNNWSFAKELAGLQQGVVWCMSSIAIYCVLQTEVDFEEQLHEHDFQPRWKFWTIKVMIGFSFSLQIVMSLIRDVFSLTLDECNLIDASLRIYVMAIVAFCNIKAWWPKARWYNTVIECDKHQRRGTLREHLLVPQSTVSLVQELLPGLSAEEARDFDKVKSKIEGKTGGGKPSKDVSKEEEEELHGARNRGGRGVADARVP